MKSLRVGIVGGAGEVGSALLKSLNTESRFSAFAICRNAVSASRIACQGMPVRIVQTENAELLAGTTRDLDALVNCAYPRYQPSKASISNQRLANSLAAACAGKHLVHLSSVAVYGEFLRGDKSLFDHPKPDIPYGRQKVQMEQLLRALAKKHSMKCTILRVGHVYGPELRWSECIFDLIKNDEFRLPFDGQLPSNGVWIQNLIAAIRELLLNQPLDATLNLTDIPQTTWREIFDVHSQASGNPAVPPLNQYESEQYLRESKKRARHGLAKRLASETWAWVKHLPASYIASVPALKAMTLWAVSQIGSEKLDEKLIAVSKRVAPAVETTVLPEVFPLFLSEPVPGPSASYQSCSPKGGQDDLAAWHHAISVPVGVPVTNSVVRESHRALLPLNDSMTTG